MSRIVYQHEMPKKIMSDRGTPIRDGSSGFVLPVSFRPDGCGFGFIFAPTGGTHTRLVQNWFRLQVSFFTRGCTRNPKKSRKEPKKPKTRGKPRWKPEKTKKTHLKTRRTPEPDSKPEGFKFGCQFSPAGAGLGVKFNPTSFFRGSGFWSTLPEPDPLSSLTPIHFEVLEEVA
jgi:hypothetical protein